MAAYEKERQGYQPLFLTTLALLTPMAFAQTPEIANTEFLREQDRERVLRERQESAPDIRPLPEPLRAMERMPIEEAPCFVIKQIQLIGDEAARFHWALKAADPLQDPATARCLGTQGIQVVMKRIQNAIVARGFVTTRILAAPQDLTSGELKLTVIPGRIRQIRFVDDTSARATAWNAVPASSGDLLNLRDIEQALENFKRVPTVEADIQITPAEGDDARPGESDLVIGWKQRSPPIRFSVALDDAGSRATGMMQGSATLSLDNLLLLNDLFYATLTNDVFNSRSKGTRAYTFHYSVPLYASLLSTTASRFGYRQQVPGPNEDTFYRGISKNIEVRLSHLLYRDATQKTGAYLRGWTRESRYFVKDTEIGMQGLRTVGWELGLTHRAFLSTSILDTGLAFRQGTVSFGRPSNPAQRGRDSTQMKLLAANAQFSAPFKWMQQRFLFATSWRGQWNFTSLVPPDQFGIGGRYSVRGFDGERSLIAERGWVWRNELGWLFGPGQEGYIGVDYGRVSDGPVRPLLGNSLAGAVVGVRGSSRHGASWDVFAGTPLYKPKGFKTSAVTTGFRLSWSY